MQRFEAYEDSDGKWRWRLWSGDGKIVASSGEAYSSQAGALQAAESVQATAPAAAISIAPGLGIKAAQRFRALLAGEDGNLGLAGDNGGLRVAPASASGSRRRPALRAVRSKTSSARVRPVVRTRPC